jgi:hypothetical protein
MRSAVESHPTNAGVLRYLADGDDPAAVSIRRPGPDTDPWRLGAHPDVVEHLWTRLNAMLPADARFLVAGGAALAHPGSGAILALALGTQYAVRLSGQGLAAALQRGHETTHEFRSVGRRLDLTATFGPGWVFGRFDPDEPTWLVESYRDASA